MKPLTLFFNGAAREFLYESVQINTFSGGAGSDGCQVGCLLSIAGNQGRPNLMYDC
jgi:hypothetical protein